MIDNSIMISSPDVVKFLNWIWPLCLTALTLPLWAKWISRYATAIRDFRRQGKAGIPLMGGVPIVLAVFIGAFISGSELSQVIALTSIPLLLVSTLDDFQQISARSKFLGQMLAVGLFLSLIPSNMLLLSRIGLETPWAQLLTGFWILGMVNAINMIDGMDGEATGFAIIVGAAAYWMFRGNPHTVTMAILISSSMGFLIYNFQPAQIYLGDLGSNFLGFFLATSAACLPLENPQVIHVAVPLMMFSFAEVDALLAMIRRWRSDTPLTQGDHQHLHHKLLKVDLSVRAAWTVIMSCVLVSAITAVGIAVSQNLMGQLILLITTTLGLSGQMLWLNYTHYLTGKRISQVSTSLLSRFLTLKLNTAFTDTPHQLVMYDLMPYYKELQQRGILSVTSFLEDFAHHISDCHPESYHVSIMGQTSVVVADPDNLVQKSVIEDFFELLDKHQVRLNDAKKPWGLHFPNRDGRMAQDIYRMLLTQTKVVPLESRRKAS